MIAPVALRAMTSLLLCATASCGRIGFESTAGSSGRDASTDAGTCPASFTVAGEHCYLYQPVMATWIDAEQFCETVPGAHLAVVDDAQEATDLVSLGIMEVIWIGISDRIVEGDYRTVTGQSSYLTWQSGFPTATPDCVEIVADGGELKSLDCASNNQYMCEWDGRAVALGNF